MKQTLRLLALVLGAAVLGFGAAGCKRAPAFHVPKGTTDGAAEKDPFKLTSETFRYSASSNDDWTRFRDGLTPLDAYFSQVEVALRLRLSPEDRKFFATEAHLTDAGFTELEATSFRTADAHYLDECYLLRDADQFLQITNLTGVEQADRHFRWVMRNVLLHEQGDDDWMPPAFTLRRGWGNAVERAMVFLALLRQASMEGCLIVVPKTEPPQFLVGVIEPKTANLRLFDPRLGLAVRGNDGKGIATLREALQEPKLLAPSGITPAQAKKLEAWLVCPLFAMSPRMLVLQEGLSRHDAIVLHLNAPALFDEVAKASRLPVKVWNPPLEGKTPANSPTRCLWMFLPKTDGGLDDGYRAESYTRSRLPVAGVIANLATINVTQAFLPEIAWADLLDRCVDLFNKYDLQPREMYLRGLQEAMFSRQNRLEPFVNNPGLKNVSSDKKVRTDEMPKWLDEVRNVYAAVDASDPRQKGKLQQARGIIWGRDPFLGQLFDVDKDEQIDRDAKNAAKDKTVLTKILAVGTRDYLEFALTRLQACAEHEKAERAQALMQAQKSPGDGARKRADEAWSDARSAWANSYLQHVSPQTKLRQYAVNVQRFGPNPGGIALKIGLLETLHLDMQKYFNAKLRLAECKAHTERAGAKAEAAYLEEVKSEIDAFTRKGTLKDEIERLGSLLGAFPPSFRAKFQQRLDLLAGDWSEHGNYYWMKRQIDERCQARR